MTKQQQVYYDKCSVLQLCILGPKFFFIYCWDAKLQIILLEVNSKFYSKLTVSLYFCFLSPLRFFCNLSQ